MKKVTDVMESTKEVQDITDNSSENSSALEYTITETRIEEIDIANTEIQEVKENLLEVAVSVEFESVNETIETTHSAETNSIEMSYDLNNGENGTDDNQEEVMDILKPASTSANETFIRKCFECSTTIENADENVLSWEIKDFCCKNCLFRYQFRIGSHCVNCKTQIEVDNLGKYCLRLRCDIRLFCSVFCLHNYGTDRTFCIYCEKEISGRLEDDEQLKHFCTQLCSDKFEESIKKTQDKKDSTQCSVCKGEKQMKIYLYRRNKGERIQIEFYCDSCFITFISVNKINPFQCDACEKYFENENPTQYSIFYKNKVRNFCGETCQITFIIRNREIDFCDQCRIIKYNHDMIEKTVPNKQIACCLYCLSQLSSRQLKASTEATINAPRMLTPLNIQQNRQITVNASPFSTSNIATINIPQTPTPVDNHQNQQVTENAPPFPSCDMVEINVSSIPEPVNDQQSIPQRRLPPKWQIKRQVNVSTPPFPSCSMTGINVPRVPRSVIDQQSIPQKKLAPKRKINRQVNVSAPPFSSCHMTEINVPRLPRSVIGQQNILQEQFTPKRRINQQINVSAPPILPSNTVEIRSPRMFGPVNDQQSIPQEKFAPKRQINQQVNVRPSPFLPSNTVEINPPRMREPAVDDQHGLSRRSLTPKWQIKRQVNVNTPPLSSCNMTEINVPRIPGSVIDQQSIPQENFTPKRRINQQVNVSAPPFLPSNPVEINSPSMCGPENDQQSIIRRSLTPKRQVHVNTIPFPPRNTPEINALRIPRPVNDQQTIPRKKLTAKRQVIERAPPFPPMKNAGTLCKPFKDTKGTYCSPVVSHEATQTDPIEDKVVMLPIPVPVYVPVPLTTYNASVPIPIAFPIPVPVPVFIPTSQNSPDGILNEIKKIKAKNMTRERNDLKCIEAAEEAFDFSQIMGVGELSEPTPDLELILAVNSITSSQNRNDLEETEEIIFHPETINEDMSELKCERENSNKKIRDTIRLNVEEEDASLRMEEGDENYVLPQMRFEQFAEPVGDFERLLTINSTRSSQNQDLIEAIEKIDYPVPGDKDNILDFKRNGGNYNRKIRDSMKSNGKEKYVDSTNEEIYEKVSDIPLRKTAVELSEPAMDLEDVLTASYIKSLNNQDVIDEIECIVGLEPTNEENSLDIQDNMGSNEEMAQSAGGNTSLIYSFGVNAWKQWITERNSKLEKSSQKLVKNGILQLTENEINESLCFFIKEIRRPDGLEYTPDTIYYFCLGIQKYLLENGRNEDIFSNEYFETFTHFFDEIAKKFGVFYNNSNIYTRVNEEHLWETKQLGCYSPQTLLNTLVYFNTKYFKLKTVDEHLNLTFDHIKIYNRKSEISSLHLNPHQALLDANLLRKLCYVQDQSEDPLKCPVMLHRFYLLKCPNNIKRSDQFYLSPDHLCTEESNYWYTTIGVGRRALEMVLNRIKMVYEINVALNSDN